jgi:Ca-activated chloride channel family protein
MPLQHTKVSIEVTAFVARTTVEQIFANPFEKPVEAVYTFRSAIAPPWTTSS